MKLALLGDDPEAFPPPDTAMREPDGLLAGGGDLSVARLLAAYRRGIFPWFGPGDPILWWSPDPRFVLVPAEAHIGRSLQRTLNRGQFRYTFNQAFADVVEACARAPRPGQPGTWITAGMRAAYVRLHQAGHAHSVETWLGDELVGGLYGVAIGRMFFGESMFARTDDASKAAFAVLCRQLAQWQFPLIDCQMETAHLARFGGHFIPRAAFAAVVAGQVQLPGPDWRLDPALAGP